MMEATKKAAYLIQLNKSITKNNSTDDIIILALRLEKSCLTRVDYRG
jgi:hypothetical protein